MGGSDEGVMVVSKCVIKSRHIMKNSVGACICQLSVRAQSWLRNNVDSFRHPSYLYRREAERKYRSSRELPLTL